MSTPSPSIRRAPARPPEPSSTTAHSVAELTPLPGVDHLARAVPEAEPARAELIEAMRAGRQPYPLVVHGARVLYGIGLLAAAREVGTRTVRAVEHTGCDDLAAGDLLIRAAGLHLRAARARRPLDELGERRRAADLYRAWASVAPHRPPREYDPERRRGWEQLRADLMLEELGHPARTLLRYARISELTDDLVTAVESGRLPIGYVERAAALPAAEQVLLAAATATTPFGELRAEFFGPTGGARKTNAAAARAVHAAVRVIAAQMNKWRGHIGLPDDVRPLAESVLRDLAQCLARSVSAATRDEQFEAGCEKIRAAKPVPAPRGGGRARRARP